MIACMSYIRNLLWKISAIVRPKKNSLVVHLHCEGGPEERQWSCKVQTTLSILPQREGCKPSSRCYDHDFNPGDSYMAYEGFISLTDIKNPKRGFLKKDSIILEAEVVTGAPLFRDLMGSEILMANLFGNFRSMFEMH